MRKQKRNWKHHEPRDPKSWKKGVESTDPDGGFNDGLRLSVLMIRVHGRMCHGKIPFMSLLSICIMPHTFKYYININNLYRYLRLLCIYNYIYDNYSIAMSVFSKYIKEIRKKGSRCFTLQQMITTLGTSHASALVGLHRLKQSGDIISPAKGFYIIVPPEYQGQGSIPPEDLVLLLMEYLNQQYYVGLLSAAQHYGATHQRPNSLQVICNKRRQHPSVFGSVHIDYIYKKKLESLPIHQKQITSGYLNIASPELVIYDLLYYSNRAGGLNHIGTVLSEMIESIDGDKLVDLALHLQEMAWLQRLGYLLDQIETEDEDKQFIITQKISDYLEGKIKGYAPLEPGISRKGYPRNKRWKIIENTQIESDL
jgi:predicted transcriptional regulator of viral defense system